MLQRFQNIDFIDLVLWIFRAVIIILVVWGTIATILDNPYSPRQWTRFRDLWNRPGQHVRTDRHRLHPGLWRAFHDQFRSRRVLHVRAP